MCKLFRIACRGLALAALSFLLAVSPTGNARSDRMEDPTERSETAKAIASLTAALKDRSYWPDQQRAAEALGQLRPAAKDAVPALIAALKDPEFFVRHSAVRALEKIGEFSPNTVAALKNATKDETPLVRDAAIEVCEDFLSRASRQDVPALIAELKDGKSLLRLAAVRRLGEVGDFSSSQEVLSVLKGAMKDKDPDLRREAATAYKRLMNSNTREDVPALIAALKDSEPFVRQDAARALGRIDGLPPKAWAALKAAMKDKDPDLRRVAVETYERMYKRLMSRASKNDMPLLIDALKDSQSIVRQQAARIMGEVGDFSLEALTALKAAAKDEEPPVRNAAREAYERLMGRAIKNDAPVLIADLKDAQPFVRQAAAGALGKVGVLSPQAWAALKAATKDENPQVQREAVEAYKRAYARRTNTPSREDVPALVAALKDRESSVRRDAAHALSKVAAFSTAPEVVAALKVATEDKDPDVRRAAAQTWERMPLVEAYLRQGWLAEAEAALSERLKASPPDDQARFGLGVLRFIRGVERLGQSLHKYGCRSENTNIPILRLPVPPNAKPAPIRYVDFCRMLDEFRRDLSAAEAILAGVTDDKVKLPLHLAAIHLDLVGKGQPTDEFIGILQKIMLRRQFDFQEANPDLLVCFDRGDVAWLRAYCHLLMGMLDFYLALDAEWLFDERADELFARPEKRFAGEKENRQQRLVLTAWDLPIAVKEPARLGQFRKHFLQVAALNRETWKHIRAETDDDHEWLPNPKQKGVLGLPVRKEMIDVWLAMMAEWEALLNGERTYPVFGDKKGKGLNLKTLLDDPPAKFVLDADFPRTLADKYFSEKQEVNLNVLFAMFQIFNDPTTAVTYAAWFN